MRHRLSGIEDASGISASVQRANKALRTMTLDTLAGWLPLVERRALNQRAFADRVEQIKKAVKAIEATLPAGWGAAYDKAKAAYLANASAASAQAEKIREEIKRLRLGGIVRDVASLRPAEGIGAAETIELPGYGPAAKVAIDWRGVPNFATPKPMTKPAPTSGPGSSPLDPPTANQQSQKDGSSPAASLQNLLGDLPAWTPYAIGGVALLLLMSGGKRR